MRRIINSTYISLDGIIQDPQDWPGNGIEPDGTGLKVQTDLLFACDAVLMGGRTYRASPRRGWPGPVTLTATGSTAWLSTSCPAPCTTRSGTTPL